MSLQARQTLIMAYSTNAVSRPFNPNPFIHGTCLGTLCKMASTNFKLMDALSLAKLGHAPPTGEITRGGWSTPSAMVMPCFGRVFGPSNAFTYNLERVLQYTKPRSGVHAPRNLCDLVDHLPTFAYANINEVLLVLVQNLANNKESMTDSIIGTLPANLLKNVQVMIQFYTMLMQVGRNVHFDPKCAVAEVAHEHYAVAADQFLRYGTIFERLQNYSDFDFSRLDEECAKAICDILALPKKAHLNVGKYDADWRLVELKTSQPYVYDPSTFVALDNTLHTNQYTIPSRYSTVCGSDYFAYRLCSNTSGFEVSRFFYHYMRQSFDTEYLNDFHKQIFGIRAGMMNAASLLQDVVSKKLKIQQNTFQTFGFEDVTRPLVIVVENEDLVQLLAPASGEYRATRHLSLLSGDISYLAVENEADLAVTSQMLKRFDISCPVILIKDLQNMPPPPLL